MPITPALRDDLMLLLLIVLVVLRPEALPAIPIYNEIRNRRSQF